MPVAAEVGRVTLGVEKGAAGEFGDLPLIDRGVGEDEAVNPFSMGNLALLIR